MVSFDISKAVNWITKNSHASSTHFCAMHVRKAMEAGGLDTHTRPGEACKYINWLPGQGWKAIHILSNVDKSGASTPSDIQPGDIAVYQKPGKGWSEPGHICMWTGKQWVSDFRQSNMLVYAGKTDIYIFRYTGERSTSGPLINETGTTASFDGSGSFGGADQPFVPIEAKQGGEITMGVNNANNKTGLIIGTTILSK